MKGSGAEEWKHKRVNPTVGVWGFGKGEHEGPVTAAAKETAKDHRVVLDRAMLDKQGTIIQIKT